MITVRWTQFAWHVHRVMQQAFASDGADPETIAAFLIRWLGRRPNSVAERTNFEQFVRKERGLVQLLHFTHLSNVQSIMRYGLVPRAHLTLRAVQMVLMPVFPDTVRADGYTEMNCLSMSHPNYGMFYVKRQQIGGDWAVLKLNPYLIADVRCEFTPTNAAAKGVTPRAGIEGARLMFSNATLRKELGLARWEPTDPQAEVIEDSVIEPRHVFGVAVATESARQKLTKIDAPVSIEPDLFERRRDYRYWQGKRMSAPDDDYQEVRTYELEEDLEIGA